MYFHLLRVCEFTATDRANIHYSLCLHLFLPLLCQLLSCTTLALFLAHLFWHYRLLLFFYLLLSFFFELLHSYWRSSFFLLDLSLSLTMIVVIFLLRSIFCSFFSFTCLVRQRLEVIVIRFVARVHNSDSLTCYSEIGFISNFVGLGCFLRWKEFNKCKIFEFTCEFVFNLSNISDRNHSLESLQQYVFLDLSNNWSSNHQTAILSRLLFEIARRWLSAVAQSAVNRFGRLTSVAFVSPCKILVITFLAVPIISKS